MGVSIRADGVGVRFLFDRQRRVITPAHAALIRRGAEAWGVRGVTLSVAAGEGVALIGPTGSGKTTMLRLIGGVLPADEGRIEVEGRVGSLLSIDAGLLPTLSGRENGLLLGVLAGLTRAEAREALEPIKARSALSDAFDRPASAFSQGMRARLTFAAAECAGFEILLLDEVHEALDHAFREVLAARTRETLAHGGIVIAAGHDHDVLRRLCPRAILLSEGRVAADGPFDQVRSEYLTADEERQTLRTEA
jgi:lipopolysaccharide transport system ATP-binding protein